MFKPGAELAGKGGKRQALALGQKATITGGDPLMRMLGQYGKGASLDGAPPSAVDSSPSAHAASHAVRGSQGGVKAHPRQDTLAPVTGGSPPGPNGSHGSPTNYAKPAPDVDMDSMT